MDQPLSTSDVLLLGTLYKLKICDIHIFPTSCRLKDSFHTILVQTFLKLPHPVSSIFLHLFHYALSRDVGLIHGFSPLLLICKLLSSPKHIYFSIAPLNLPFLFTISHCTPGFLSSLFPATSMIIFIFLYCPSVPNFIP